MILNDISELAFPVIYFSNTLTDITINKNQLHYDKKYLVHKLSDNIIDDFAAANAPSIEIYRFVAEFIVGNFNIRKQRAFIDNNFKLRISKGTIIAQIFTVTIDEDIGDYFLTEQLPCYIEKVIPNKGFKYALVARINSMYFHIGWENEIVNKSGVI